MKNTIFDVVIEIPKGERNKYEFDKNKGMIRLDRITNSSMVYPADYGYIPNTLADDGDPLDAMVILTLPTIPACIVKVKAIGVFFMTDDKGKDEKIICVPISDPNYNHLNNINELPIQIKKEIEHFFKFYKEIEKKKIIIKGWGNNIEALKVYNKCLKKFNK